MVLRRTRKAILTQQYNGVVVTAEALASRCRCAARRGRRIRTHRPTLCWPMGRVPLFLLLTAAHHPGRGRLGRGDDAGARQALHRADVLHPAAQPGARGSRRRGARRRRRRRQPLHARRRIGAARLVEAASPKPRRRDGGDHVASSPRP